MGITTVLYSVYMISTAYKHICTFYTQVCTEKYTHIYVQCTSNAQTCLYCVHTCIYRIVYNSEFEGTSDFKCSQAVRCHVIQQTDTKLNFPFTNFGRKH